jgi:hypothetical protein
MSSVVLLHVVLSVILFSTITLSVTIQRDRRYWNGDISFQTHWLSRLLIMPVSCLHSAILLSVIMLGVILHSVVLILVLASVIDHGRCS